MRSLLLICSTVLFIGGFQSSCKPPITPTAPDPLTEKFRVYLKVNFGDSIPSNPHLYILISNKDSKENVSQMLSRLHLETQTRKKETISTIISVKMPIDDSLLTSGKIHNDWNAEVDKFRFVLSAITLLKTDSGKVVDIHHLSLDGNGMETKFLK